MENDYRVVVPVLPGYDLSNESDFVSVEQHAAEIGDWLLSQGIARVHAVYGCSMGGSIALRDFLLMTMGKWGGEKLMAKAFSSSEHSDDDYAYIANIMKHCSYKTLWNTFDSCNNYRMPKEPMHLDTAVHYWYAEKERKARDWDIKFMQKFVPQTEFAIVEGADHGDLAFFFPERFEQEIRALSK